MRFAAPRWAGARVGSGGLEAVQGYDAVLAPRGIPAASGHAVRLAGGFAARRSFSDTISLRI